MTEDEQNKETSEEQSDQVEETPAEAQEDQAAGPVAEEAPDDSAAGPVAEEDAPSSQATEETPSPTPPADEAVEAEQEPAAEEAKPAAEAEAEQPKKAREAIPGADLEPIAVEQEERELSAEERARVEAEEEERARREAELVGDAVEEEEAAAAPRAPAKLESGARYLATGKRKNAIARVIVLPGSGKIEVNRRPLEEFFPRPLHQTTARQPLTTTGYDGSVDVRVRVHGGGISGQAGAVRHGIARALTEVDPELRGELKRRGFLTRDARVKERRKAGLKKARKRPQFSKR
jgi:small subunit ribosomal protein S9